MPFYVQNIKEFWPSPFLDFSSLHGSFDVFFDAIRADSVGEFGLGMIRDIGFDLLPVVLVVPDFFAVAAYGQESLEGFNFRQSLFQHSYPLGKGGLQFDDPLAHPDAGA